MSGGAGRYFQSEVSGFHPALDRWPARGHIPIVTTLVTAPAAKTGILRKRLRGGIKLETLAIRMHRLQNPALSPQEKPHVQQ